MRIGIMQPYFLPYIGYFQLMAAVDEFVVYDNIQFSKKGWIHRNRILTEAGDSYISLPLKKDSDFLDIVHRKLADTFPDERSKLLRRVHAAYRKAPMFDRAFSFLEVVMAYEKSDLFGFLLNSLLVTSRYCGITTPLVVSSSIPMDHTLKGSQRVLGICHQRRCDTYMNPIGGVHLYDRGVFADSGVNLEFLRSDLPVYRQFGKEFVPALSILDVFMFNDAQQIDQMLRRYEVL